jgi:hypothetical protein
MSGLIGCISWFVIESHSGARTRARMSEAIHRRHRKKSWIASSHGLLAMTVKIPGQLPRGGKGLL